MNNMSNEREIMLKRLQVCDFALNDAALYLDTRPDDQQALDFFQKYQSLRARTLQEYTSRFGPITHLDYAGGRWVWTDNPWPWHKSGEVV